MKPRSTTILLLAAAPLLLALLAGCRDSTGDQTALAAAGEEMPLRGKLVVTGSSTVAPLAAEIGKRFERKHPQVRVDVQTGGTSRGIADTLSGVADLGMASRSLTPDELAEGLAAHRIALDGVCLIVHADNPVASLSDRQTVSIYTGAISNWSDLGGSDSEIVVVNKAEGRATLEVFLEHFRLKAAEIEADIVSGDNQHVIQTVAGNRAAIGYVSLGEAQAETRGGTAIRLLAADGIPPTAEEVSRGAYPIVRPVSLITRGKPSGLARSLLEFAQSEEVHDLVEQHGFVPFGG